MTEINASITALRKLLKDKKDVGPENQERLIKQLAGKNDRLVAVVGAAMLDDVLESSLLQIMPNKTAAKKLFGHRGALSTFAAKIDVAHSFGILDAELRRNSDYIREIRNVFGHRIAPTSFATKEVKAVCKLLTMSRAKDREVAKNGRVHFMHVMFYTAIHVAVRSAKLSALLEKQPTQ